MKNNAILLRQAVALILKFQSDCCHSAFKMNLFYKRKFYHHLNGQFTFRGSGHVEHNLYVPDAQMPLRP